LVRDKVPVVAYLGSDSGDVSDLIVGFIRRYSDLDHTFTVDTLLGGIINSFHLVALVAHLEKELQIEFEQSDLTNEPAWLTVRAIAALVELVRTRAVA
jgi:acyl carrier protein